MTTASETSNPPAPPASADVGGGGKKQKKKQPPADFVKPPPKPKLSKAERRALQEAQRAAKAAGGGPLLSSSKPAAVASVASSTSAAGTSQQQQQSKDATGVQQQQQQSGKGGGVDDGGGMTGGTDGSTSKKHYYEKTVSLVAHLSPYRTAETIFETGGHLIPKHFSTKSLPSSVVESLHPAVIELGYRYATKQIRGGNARCRAMLQCYQRVLTDYVPPSTKREPVSCDSLQLPPGYQSPQTTGKGSSNRHHKGRSSASMGSGSTSTAAKFDLRQALDHDILKPSFQYWTERCRQHCVGMGNAFTFIKTAVASLDRDVVWNDDVRDELIETLVAFQQERIEFADKAIADLTCTKIIKGDSSNMNNHSASIVDEKEEVILTYGNSEVIRVVLQEAHERGKHFRVIVVDNRPMLEGQELLEYLRRVGIECTYILLNALTYVIQDVTKVLLGASALMSDGSILGRVGTACVAMTAYASKQIPVLVCSETYKISNRVQLESITGNELGDPESLLRHPHNNPVTAADVKRDTDHDETLTHWKDVPKLKLLNVMYDLTPAEFISGIVTEFGIVPPTSVAVLLREMYPSSTPSALA